VKKFPLLLLLSAMSGVLFSDLSPLLAAPPANAPDFEKLSVSDGMNTLPYRLFSPKVLEAGKQYPVVLFLHGAGERGDDNEAQLRHGLSHFASEQCQARHPAFLVVPQCPKGKKWSEVDWALPKSPLPEQPSSSMNLAMQILDRLIQQKLVDPKRVYVTGISMGGYGTWDAATRWPQRFAAAVPVCGGGDEDRAASLVHLPIWCFHGDADKAVLVERSRNMIEAVRKAGGQPKYSEYPGVGHNSWDKAYADPDLYEWLFAQKLP
jgi:predicted peptidase